MSTAIAPSPPKARPMRTLRVADVTGQKLVRVRIPVDERDLTIDEVIAGLLPRMQLPTQANGRALTYAATLEREGRQLLGSDHPSALREDDLLVLAPSITAG